MKVKIAEKAGFCMGVRRAVDMTLDFADGKEAKPIQTFGPLIHNPQVLDFLKEKGVEVLQSIPDKGKGTVIIRAHGVPPASKQKLNKAGYNVEDATCPRVVKVQVIIKKHKEQGKTTVIIGDRNHAEVEGLLGYAGKDSYVVSSEEDALALVGLKSYIIVSQTTQDKFFFERAVEIITKANPGGQVFNTICDSTHKRQEEVRKLCQKVDVLVVVGGLNSANTTRLGEIARAEGKKVHVIETEGELDREELSQYHTVGVTAGASTPNWMIKKVVKALEGMGNK